MQNPQIRRLKRYKSYGIQVCFEENDSAFPISKTNHDANHQIFQVILLFSNTYQMRAHLHRQITKSYVSRSEPDVKHIAYKNQFFLRKSKLWSGIYLLEIT